LSPVGAVDDLAHRLFSSTSVTRWHHTSDQVPEASTNDHIGWVRTPATLVDRAVVATRTIHLKETQCRPFSAPADRSPTSS
jgi:hypothetical protein